ncbi:MAG: hypothetical protein ACR2JI_09280 [Mycobacterium sp.]
MASFLTAAILAGAAAAAIALAPTAGADTPPSPCRGAACTDSGPGKNPVNTAKKNPLDTTFSNDLPTGWKNDAQWARPGPASSNPFGSGPRPPVVALD